MSDMLSLALGALQTALEEETAALAAGDLRRAATGSATKSAAIEAFLAIRARLTPAEATVTVPRMALSLERLREAVQANRVALERGLALQGHVVEAIARAAQQGEAMPSGAGYGRAVRPAVRPLAVSVRA